MSGPILKMNAYVRAEIGMRVYYDCPMMNSDSYESDQFFRKYHGSFGEIVGFPEKHIGLLDTHGRLPGVYYSVGGIHVRFDGEEIVHRNKNLLHFILLSKAETVHPEFQLSHQKMRDLSPAIEYYPGDAVYRADDLLKTLRVIKYAHVNEDTGKIQYHVPEEEAVVIRKNEEQRRREARVGGPTIGTVLKRLTSTERHSEIYDREHLELCSRGRIYYLYNATHALSFQSDAEELAFWMATGITKAVYFGSQSVMPIVKMSESEARKRVERGDADLTVPVRQFGRVEYAESGPSQFKVYKLHECFGSLRERVRTFGLMHRVTAEELYGVEGFSRTVTSE